ncbi:Sensory transduction protein LytR [Lentibacillus sp. JNUCC-1]|uniref:response regulator n=1 Tax=Lentibacillus sp. JNUCC-1 TaxID=2654513 RepID=UPI0012E8A912|nr:response regulator [Lentibacillus sp. JNUCC-1]MUV38127.1 Sensory transduction protein LytR [Lentibacillus sp. JNUCC-1]
MRAILVDDEYLALQYLERMIGKVSNIEIVATFTYLDLNRHASIIESVDLVFLDIEMPGMNGLELAERITEVNPGIDVVFVTAFNEYAVQAFELNALDYVMKPVQLERLKKTIERIENSKPDGVSSDHDTLQISVFGELDFARSDQHIRLQWRTKKAEELFLYLLLRTGETIHKSTLVDVIWTEYDLDKAYAHLYTAIYHIRKTLSPYKNYLTVKNRQEGYVLYTDNIALDTWQWEKQVRTMPPVAVDTIADHEAVMDMYTAPYLAHYDYIWTDNERFRLEHLWLQHAYKLADFYQHHDDLEKAQEWYIQICSTSPEEEHAALALMKLYALHGYRGLVTHQFNTLKHALKKVDIPMDPDIVDWYEQWKNTYESN